MDHEQDFKAHPEGFEVVEMEGNIFDAPEYSVLIPYQETVQVDQQMWYIPLAMKLACLALGLPSVALDASTDTSGCADAVNCQGVWGSGIAEAFKSKYPAAFEVYKLHCKDAAKLPGTCLLIPPTFDDNQPSLLDENDLGVRPKRRRINPRASTKKHWVGCLFTSYGYGKPTKFKAGKDSPEKILSNTRAALKELRAQVEELDAGQLDLAEQGSAGRTNDLGKINNEAADRNRRTDGSPERRDTKLDITLGPLYACKFNSGSFGVEWKDTRALIEEVFDGSSKAMRIVSPPSQRN